MDERSLIFCKHIIQNIEKIDSFTKGMSKDDLLSDELKQYALVRALEIIGEAAKNLPSSFKKEHSEIPWKDIIGSRDKMIHHYFGVDFNIVWDIIQKDLPDLKKNLEKTIKNS